MDDLTRKRQFVRELANKLVAEGKTIDGGELAIRLNSEGHRTSYRTVYKGGRGTYTLISAVYRWLEDDIDSYNEARAVAEAFTKPDGSFAYDK